MVWDHQDLRDHQDHLMVRVRQVPRDRLVYQEYLVIYQDLKVLLEHQEAQEDVRWFDEESKAVSEPPKAVKAPNGNKLASALQGALDEALSGILDRPEVDEAAVRKIAEDHKVGIRESRRDAIGMLKDLEKDGGLGKDDRRRAEGKAQELTDRFTSKLDELTAHKEKEVLEV